MKYLCGEPAGESVELAHPAVLVALRHDGDDVVLPEPKLVVVTPLKVGHGPGPLPLALGHAGVRLVVLWGPALFLDICCLGTHASTTSESQTIA